MSVLRDYFSPEMIATQEADQKTDIWSLGITILFLMKFPTPWAQPYGSHVPTKPLPFFDRLMSIIKWDVEKVSFPGYSPELQAFVKKMLLQVCIIPFTAFSSEDIKKTHRITRAEPARRS